MWNKQKYSLFLGFSKYHSLICQMVFTGLGCYFFPVMEEPSHLPSWIDILGGHSIMISLLDEDLKGHSIIFNDTDDHICSNLQPFTFLDMQFSSCDLKLII